MKFLQKKNEKKTELILFEELYCYAALRSNSRNRVMIGMKRIKL
jgi:hypothetical protein